MRKSQKRGHAGHCWLDSYHIFSFAHYNEPRYMGYAVLRVINEDVIAPGRGFGMHAHNDKEIITYMLDGELRHEDSLGNGSVLRKVDVQRMTAASGIVHSELNEPDSNPVHLLQIWILHERINIHPGSSEEHTSELQSLMRI